MHSISIQHRLNCLKNGNKKKNEMNGGAGIIIKSQTSRTEMNFKG